MTDVTDATDIKVPTERVRQMGIANVLAMLSHLAMNDPDALREVLTADLQPTQRWDTSKAA